MNLEICYRELIIRVIRLTRIRGGSYDFGNYVLSIDHVQGRSVCRTVEGERPCRGTAAKFPADLYRMKCRRLAVCDYLLRQFGRELERVSFKAKGSGRADFWR